MSMQRVDGSLAGKALPRLLLCLGVALVGGSGAVADPIDELLSGKAVIVSEEAAAEEAIFAPLPDDEAAAQDVASSSSETASADESSVTEAAAEPQTAEASAKPQEPSLEEQLATDPSWSVGLSDPANLELDFTVREVPGRTSSLPTPFTVVPEPSAIALAAASLVYFLIFFRRRYWA
jgi:hypothetical protein